MSTPDTKVLYMIAILNETYIEELGLAICVSPLFTCRLVHCRQVEDIRNLNKKKFLFCYPHTLTIGLEAPVYRGFSGEGKGEGVRAEMGEGPFY